MRRLENKETLRSPLRVLIVEDSVDDATVLLWALHDSGYAPLWECVKTATAMRAALEQQPWDIVIAADVLSQCSIREVRRVLQERHCDPPLLVLTNRQSETSERMDGSANAWALRKDRLTDVAAMVEQEVRAAQARHTLRAAPGTALPPPASTLTSGAAVQAPHAQEAEAAEASVIELRHAIAHNQLLLHYQPQLSLSTDRLVGAEALVRWRHPRRGLIPPDQFIPLAERTGEILPLTHWVLNAALRQCQRWGEQQTPIRIAVNFSMCNLQDPDCADTLLALCQMWRVSPAQLTVEITESVLMTEPDRVRAALTHLREHGVRIALDDLGAGYASLAAVRQLPIDEIKIDRSFIQGMREDAKTGTIVRVLIELGHALGLQVVAEGVEDRETYERLAAFRCDVVQGYYVSRPLAAADFSVWMQRSPWRLEPIPARSSHEWREEGFYQRTGTAD